MYDVFFISYDEAYADRHWSIVRGQIPYARRVKGVKGIHSAHARAATMALGSHFFVIDSDNEVINWDIFSMEIEEWATDYVHLWNAKNPVNGLCYGWGGIKLFPKKMFRGGEMPLDMTTSFPLRIMEGVGSITHFNYSAEEAWRSAFRECVKLSLKEDEEAKERLATWVSKASGPFSEYVLLGANQGAEYGRDHCDDMPALLRINDYEWLKDRFKSAEPKLQ